jgi:hypothetical protein
MPLSFPKKIRQLQFPQKSDNENNIITVADKGIGISKRPGTFIHHVLQGIKRYQYTGNGTWTPYCKKIY